MRVCGSSLSKGRASYLVNSYPHPALRYTLVALSELRVRQLENAVMGLFNKRLTEK